jgi:hypothetical protein
MYQQKIVELIKEICDDGNDDSVSFYNGYSGRCMYGEQCVGITGSMSSCMQVIAEAIKHAHNITDRLDFNAVVDTLLDIHQDTLGRDIIIYWPRLEAIKS